MRITTTRIHLVLAACCVLTGTAYGLWVALAVVALTLLRGRARHALRPTEQLAGAPTVHPPRTAGDAPAAAASAYPGVRA